MPLRNHIASILQIYLLLSVAVFTDKKKDYWTYFPVNIIPVGRQ